MIGLNILNANTKKIQEADWIISGISLHEHCKRLRYVEKTETLDGLDINIPKQGQVDVLLDAAVFK